MAYSKDLREKVLSFLEEGHSKAEAKRVFGIAVTTINDWIKLKNETGNLQKRELNRTFKKIEPEKLKTVVKEYPDATLEELAAEFHCTDEAVRKALEKLNITRKKRRSSTENATKKSGENSRKP